MKRKLIYYETMSVQWISEGLRRFFEDIGYKFISNTVQEIKEALVPLDRIYVARKERKLLLFALQFKTPYRRQDIICWKVDPDQHRILSGEFFSRFIWYCLPFMKNISSWKNILYHSLFVNPQLCICRPPVRWFIWDDYFLYFYPGLDPCNRFLEEFQNLRFHYGCIPIPISIPDKKLSKASKSQWNYVISYDSWGTLFYKLLSSEVGFAVESQSDYDAFKRHIYGEKDTIKEEAIIIVVDVIEQTVSAINIISKPQEIEPLEEQEDSFPLSFE